MSKLYAVDGTDFSPTLLTRPNLDMYMQRARPNTTVRGISLAHVEPDKRRVNFTVGDFVDHNDFTSWLETLSTAIDPTGDKKLAVAT